MKRHPALEQLSRDHHHALVVAQRLKRAQASTADEAREAFLDYWTSEGRAHFREEEEILLPTLARFTDPDQPVVTRVLLDHVRIRRLAAELADDSPLAQLHTLGAELQQHVRREERDLFGVIEETIPEIELLELAARLAP